ncbi:CBS domain-containing protein [Streptomyces avicenniae]|uniref:CBS domain-containing protein n=1 Tax=Streptomyces avicenniae TaxID=500153 RepID=UPI00069976A0|nr:CBS domain-containing protein [Streptomyces avicenniae]
MTTAADIMTPGPQWISEEDTLYRAAQLMRELDVGALPVSDSKGRMSSILTDRDIVLRCVADGLDPAAVTAGELSLGAPHTITADADLTEVLQQMSDHQIRRLPVLDGDKQLVGIISESDLARELTDDQLADFVSSVYA